MSHRDHWESTTLAQVVEVRRGRILPPTRPDLPFVGMDDVEAHTMRLLRTSKSAEMKSAAIHFKPGDVLYGRLRPYLNKVITADAEGLASAEFIPLTPRDGVESKFIQYRLNSSDFVSFASHLDEGDRPRVDFTQIGGFVIELPPADEQRAIVATIESFFTRLDDAVATLKRVQQNLKRYRASVLKAAVEGRLVPTEAARARAKCGEYEPASALLARILVERRQRWEAAELAKLKANGKPPKDDKWKAKYQEPVQPDTEGLPELPEGWCWATVDCFTWDAGYGTSEKCAVDADGPPVIRIPNVQSGALRFDNLKFASRSAKLRPQDALRPRDFVFIRTNGSVDLVGRGALVAESMQQDFFFASYLIRLRLVHEAAVARWFALFWHTPQLRRLLVRDAASSAGQHNVSLSSVRSYPIPLPPQAEQLRILAEVERAESLFSAADGLAGNASSRSAPLRQSILKWAFEGRLST